MVIELRRTLKNCPNLLENIQSKAIAGKLDATDVAGTDIRMMSYSYVNSKEKSSFEVNAINDEGTRSVLVPSIMVVFSSILCLCSLGGMSWINCSLNSLRRRVFNLMEVAQVIPLFLVLMVLIIVNINFHVRYISTMMLA